MIVLFVSPITTHPKVAGWNERVYQMVDTVRSLGFDTYLCLVDLPPFGSQKIDSEFLSYWQGNFVHFKTRWKKKSGFWTLPLRGLLLLKLKQFVNKVLNSLGINKISLLNNFQFKDDWCPLELRGWLEKFYDENKLSAVILEYPFMAAALDCLPESVIKVIDMHDVFSNRNSRLSKQGIPTSWLNLYNWQEKSLLCEADFIIAIQETEELFIKEELKFQNNICTIDILLESTFFEDLAYNKTIGFLASSNPINFRGLQWFIDDIWPLIFKRVPGSILLIGGSICQNVSESYQNIFTVGHLTDLKDFYGKCRLMINPCIGGTGLKIKTVESLQYGKPLVTTSYGAEGLINFVGCGFFIENDTLAFAKACIDLLDDDDLVRNLSKKATEFICQRRIRNIELLKCMLDAN